VFRSGYTGGIIRSDETSGVASIRALEEITLDIHDGDRLGLIGHNGAGKSTLLRVMARCYEPTAGTIEVEGRISPLFNTAMGMDPDDTGYENIFNIGLFLGMTPDEVRHKVDEVEDFAELGAYLNLPVRIYSTGMMVRLSFGIATAIQPEILLLDEGLGAGDARFAEKAKRRVDELIERSSILVLATHGDAMMLEMCTKGVLLEEVIASYNERVAQNM
jgi:ABC-2 type transport system ATP-binding protein/lipopolysaccharide transport system ATP-binding protein